MSNIHTERLELVPGTPAALRAELDSRAALAGALGAEVPSTWPPEYYDHDAVRWSLAWLEANPHESGWGFYYVVLRGDAPRRLLIGAGGYKGAPADGAVEIGYGIVEDRRRCGYASEAARTWL